MLSHTVLLKYDEDANLEMIEWPGDKEDEVRNKAMMKHLEEFYNEEHRKRVSMADKDLVFLVEELFDCKDHIVLGTEQIPAVELNGVSIAYNQERILLKDINFVRQTHQHWALLGPNGSGKSSLMRVLMQTPGHGLTKGEVVVVGERVCVSGLSSHKKEAPTDSRPRLAAVSTDQHIQLLHRSLQSDQTEDQTAFNLIENDAASLEAAKLAMRLLLLPEAVRTRPLTQLSQGEQKLVLIARALAARPQLLILDEISHGLDPFNRAHVLRVIQAIGQHAAHKTHLVFITHHESEITPCFSTIVEIKDKQLVKRDA